MRQLLAPAIALLVLSVGVSAVPAQEATAASASQAVEEYIRAASDSNLTRMAQRFGTDKGTLTRQGVAGADKRMVITHAYLAGVKVRALSEVKGAKSNERIVTTEISRGPCKVIMPVTAVQSSKDGWLVRNLDLDTAREVNQPCAGSSGNLDE
jgi:hypothetical protein